MCHDKLILFLNIKGGIKCNHLLTSGNQNEGYRLAPLSHSGGSHQYGLNYLRAYLSVLNMKIRKALVFYLPFSSYRVYKDHGLESII
ncbi:hypothetical protein XIS1_590001 [Xenorhabdus innexi]|uniref:Uncharacterized protein n=1 Tax=Xenorhabdus innexi TaxID=290109 RepID=A0A1N6MZE4_9GAMM|nr:hypothetical protein XIS1_590001 [Xenorhabdus innexi]